VDLKSAFDTILPQLIYKAMKLEKFPTIYMDAMHQLTGSSTGRVFANSILGHAFRIACRSGQGDPQVRVSYNYQGQNAEGLKRCRDYLTQLIQ
jgi:hypothetical protein